MLRLSVMVVLAASLAAQGCLKDIVPLPPLEPEGEVSASLDIEVEPGEVQGEPRAELLDAGETDASASLPPHDGSALGPPPDTHEETRGQEQPRDGVSAPEGAGQDADEGADALGGSELEVESEDDVAAVQNDTEGPSPLIDECLEGLDDCHPQALCEDSEAGWVCTCLPGFEGDGQSCADLDECAEALDDCAPDAACTNTEGGWSCACLSGYSGDGVLCEDIDECLEDSALCHPDATCTNTEGSFSCACGPGLIGDGLTCEPEKPGGPPGVFLTLSRLPDYLNGSLPYYDASLGGDVPFFVRTSLLNTCLDVAPLAESGPVDWSSLSLSCDQPFIAEGAEVVAAGDALSLSGLAPEGEDQWRSICVAFTEPLVDAMVHCSASVTSPSGEMAGSEIVFLTTPMLPNLDPMGSPETWVLSFERDTWAHAAPLGFLGMNNTFVEGGNGRSDFDESMAAIGLMHLENVAVSEWVRVQLEEAVKRHFEACFDPRGDGGIPMKVYRESASDSPTNLPFSHGPRDASTYSVLAIGGWDPLGDSVWGRCPYDPNNQRNQDVRDQPELGVMSAQIASAILTSDLSAGYPAELIPQVGGTAFGAEEGDAIVLGLGVDEEPGLSAPRVAALMYGVEIVAAFTALVACHEVGHSMGLVPNGPPPLGLFGGVTGPVWVGEQTTPMHCEIGNNIMGAAVSIYDAYEQLVQPRVFTPLVEAYLRSEIVVGQPETNARLVFFTPFPNQVPTGVTFEACMDSANDYVCQSGGQSGTMAFYGAPSNTFVSVELTGGPFARSLYQYYLYGVDEPDVVYDYWANVVDESVVEELRSFAGMPPEVGTGVVWASVLTKLEDQFLPGSAETRVSLNGSTEGALCVRSTYPLVVEPGDGVMGPGVSCEHVVYLNVTEGQHTLTIEGLEGSAPYAKSCVPLAGWAQYGGNTVTLDVMEGTLSRPILACE